MEHGRIDRTIRLLRSAVMFLNEADEARKDGEQDAYHERKRDAEETIGFAIEYLRSSDSDPELSRSIYAKYDDLRKAVFTSCEQCATRQDEYCKGCPWKTVYQLAKK